MHQIGVPLGKESSEQDAIMISKTPLMLRVSAFGAFLFALVSSSWSLHAEAQSAGPPPVVSATGPFLAGAKDASAVGRGWAAGVRSVERPPASPPAKLPIAVGQLP